MFISYFSEQPMSLYPEDQARLVHDFDHMARDPGDTVPLFSNRFFDPEIGARLYQERLEEILLAEEVGFDGIMVNEHHNGPVCMVPRCNIMSAVLAGVTKRVRIVQMGNPIPVWDDPVQLAEETAMIDMISGGRLVAGVVRGGGAEQFANNANPAFNRERFEEGHDLLVKAWTQPGPFRWEGNHYQFPVVNPWARPLQQPHPRVWVPGVTSAETVMFAAKHRYPYVVLSSTMEDTKKIWELYDRTALETGYTPAEDVRGYLMRCHVQSDSDRALRNAAQFNWMEGEFSGVSKPWIVTPAGYSSVSSRLARLQMIAKQKKLAGHDELLKTRLETMEIIAGDPKSCIEKIRIWLEETRPSILMLWANDGKINHADSMECIRLLGEEVLPAVREIGDELGIKDPFQANSPVSLEHSLAMV